jgi:putative CocE/NonD family hydrolase
MGERRSLAPADAERLTLFLADGTAAVRAAAGGDLTTQPPASGVARWTHDPERPVPYLQESEWGQLADLRDEAPSHTRPDVPTFTTDLVRELAGPVVAHLSVRAESPTTHVVVRLHDVYPDGRARFLLGGAQLAETSAGVARVRVRLGDIAYRLRPRHRLRLAVSTSLAPLYLVHPGTGDDPWCPRATRRAAQEVVLGGQHSSRLELTVRRRSGVLAQ